MPKMESVGSLTILTTNGFSFFAFLNGSQGALLCLAASRSSLGRSTESKGVFSQSLEAMGGPQVRLVLLT